MPIIQLISSTQISMQKTASLLLYNAILYFSGLFIYTYNVYLCAVLYVAQLFNNYFMVKIWKKKRVV